MKEIKEGEFVNIFKMTTSQKDTVISKEIIIALRKKGGSDTKRAIVEYFRKNSEDITEEYIDFRRISEKSNKEYSPFEFFINFIATNFSKIITSTIKEKRFNKISCTFNSWWIARS